MGTSHLHSILPPTSLFLFFVILLLLSQPTPSFCLRKCNVDDRKALLAIRDSWGNNSYLNTEREGHRWGDPAIACCFWEGVGCTDDYRVDSIFIFDDQNLTGTLPTALADLPFLQNLDLRQFPNLVGPLIPALARIPMLSSLTIQQSGLSGPIPSFLGSMTNLVYLDLSFNKFTGRIPPELSSLQMLGVLRLDGNRLTGPIPDSISRLNRSGVSIYLSRNGLTGTVPRSIGAVDFANLDLSRNKLSGDASFLLQSTVSTSIQSVDISWNMFVFNLTEVELGQNLSSLDISHNKIYGSIPQQIVELQQLRALNVSYNRLCGMIPTGGNMGRFDGQAYEHNSCLCGTPLPPCK